MVLGLPVAAPLRVRGRGGAGTGSSMGRGRAHTPPFAGVSTEVADADPDADGERGPGSTTGVTGTPTFGVPRGPTRVVCALSAADDGDDGTPTAVVEPTFDAGAGAAAGAGASSPTSE